MFKNSYYQILELCHIRPMLTADITKSVVCSPVNARLDYANLVLFGVTSKNILKLQMVQNTLACVVTGLQHNDHFAPTLKQLSWLPIKSRIDFNTLDARSRSTDFAQTFIWRQKSVDRRHGISTPAPEVGRPTARYINARSRSTDFFF